MGRYPTRASAAAVDETAPWVLEFDGSNHLDIGTLCPTNFMLGNAGGVEWLAKKTAALNGYLIAHGYGGDHQWLAGFSSGNFHTRNAGGAESSAQFGFDYQVSPGEVVQQAIILDGAGGIWCYTNDFLDGYSTFPAGHQRFSPAGTANKRCTLGASGGHAGQPSRLGRMRVWDRECPVVTASLPFHQRWERLGEEATGFEVSSVVRECDLYLPFWQRHTADKSSRGVQGRDGQLDISGNPISGFDGRHNGFLFEPQFGGEVQATPGTSGFISGLNYPRFVRDADFKPGAAHKGVVPTAATMPANAIIWDSFKRPAQLFQFTYRPTLGYTEGGSAGPLQWKQAKVHNGDTSRRDFWCIMGGYAIPACRNFGCAAWVEYPSLPTRYRVSVGCESTAVRKDKVTSLSARARQTGVDGNGDPIIDCLFLFFDSAADKLRLGRIAGNNLDLSGLPAAWTIPTSYTEITLDVDDDAGTVRPGYRTAVGGPVTYLASAISNTDFSGAKGAGLFSGGGDRFGASATRIEDFHVEALP